MVALHSQSPSLCFFWSVVGETEALVSAINLCCAFIFYQPMKKFDFFLATRASRSRRKEKNEELWERGWLFSLSVTGLVTKLEKQNSSFPFRGKLIFFFTSVGFSTKFNVN